MYCWQIFHGPDASSPPDGCPCENLIRSGSVKAGEMEVQAFDGFYLVSCSPIYNIEGDIDHVIHIAINITEKVRAEQSLHEVNQKLRLLTGLTSHDILNQVHLTKSIMKLCHETSDPDDILRHISSAYESGNRIESIIGFTRSYENFGSASPGWLRINQVINNAISELILGSITVQNHIAENLEIYGDPMMRNVFVNLVDNTVRHGGEITFIRFDSVQEMENLLISYTDNVAGIPSQEKEAIFSHNYEKNTGIGLFLSREILAITGISIRETGMEGEGARFEITFPKGKYRNFTE